MRPLMDNLVASGCYAFWPILGVRIKSLKSWSRRWDSNPRPLGKIPPLGASLEIPAQLPARSGRIRAPFQGFLVHLRGNGAGPPYASLPANISCCDCSISQIDACSCFVLQPPLPFSHMNEMPTDLRPATPDDVKDALSFALRFDGRKHYPRANEFMAHIVAEHLLAHLERCGFVVMKKPDLPGHRSPQG
jgi:hypothetical protein